MPSIGNLLTLAVTALATAAPFLTTVIPPPYNAMVAVLASTLGSTYHLYTASPNSK